MFLLLLLWRVDQQNKKELENERADYGDKLPKKKEAKRH